jgi:hypothetical protein
VAHLDEPVLLLLVPHQVNLGRLVVERVRVRSLELLAEDGDLLAVGGAESVLERSDNIPTRNRRQANAMGDKRCDDAVDRRKGRDGSCTSWMGFMGEEEDDIVLMERTGEAMGERDGSRERRRDDIWEGIDGIDRIGVERMD